MSGEAFGFDEDTDEVVPEEWPTFYTPVPVWVLLCGCSAQAYRMYAFLAEHINNRTPGKRIAFPSQKAVAKAMVLKDYRDVAKYREELAALGAIRFEEFRYAGGMRRRYRYWVRFNPPEGYTGLLSLADFYEANPDVKAKKSKPIKDEAQEISAGQPGGGKNPTSGGGKKPTAQGGKSPTAQQLDQAQPDPVQEEDGDAPSGRSPVDGRSPSTSGSSACAREGGFAASGKTSPSPTPNDDTRRPAQGQKSGSKKAAHTREQLDVVRRVRAFYPPEIRDDLPELPVISEAILLTMAKEGRSVEQMGQRILSRWLSHNYAAKFAAGELENVVGAAIGMVRPLVPGDRYACPDIRCEDGRVDDEPCRLCVVRIADWEAARTRERAAKGHQAAPGAPNGAQGSGSSVRPVMPPQRAAQPAAPLLRDCANDQCPASIPVTGNPLCGTCQDEQAEAEWAAQVTLGIAEEAESEIDEDALETARLRAEIAAQYGTPEQKAAYCSPAPF
ncbi:hypothetical protein ABZ802_31490 [Streptomyces sp. NPDC047737]|uniref:hypothetical protein n=1 Tax=Streptomyces sp. NPDC047737 TaxID=3155740 RepID=UPI0034085BA6